MSDALLPTSVELSDDLAVCSNPLRVINPNDSSLLYEIIDLVYFD